MLEIEIPETRLWDEKDEKFIILKKKKLKLEHSLISISKWEMKYHKPFLGKEKKTEKEIKDYIRFMTITPGISSDVYDYLTTDVLDKILDYIDDPMTATKFYDNGRKKNGQIKKGPITSESIYSSMIILNIPIQFEKWHLNRLMTLIKKVDLETTPKEKMSKKEIYAQNAKLNAQRRAKYKTKG